MKRLLLIMIAAALCVNTLHAQIRIGAKGGLSFANPTEALATGEMRMSGHVGLLANFYLFEFKGGGFAVQPEVVYNRKGGGGLQLDYVEVPLTLCYRLPLKHTAPLLFASPYYAWMVHKHALLDEAKRYTVARADYGVKLGAGIEIRFFYLSAAYCIGFKPIVSEVKALNRCVEVSLGFFFLR